MLKKEWVLHVKGLAKIEKADVKISPLICFVGDNNSGKSYLMSLLWGILTLGKDIFPKAPSDAKSYKKCEKWLKDNIGNRTEIKEEIIRDYISWFNDLLSVNKKKILTRIYNYEVDAAFIEIRDYCRQNKLELRWEEEGIRYSSNSDYIKFPLEKEISREKLLRMNSYICWNILMEGIAAPLFTPVVKGRRMGEPVYLPASRTGFMLTYPQLIEQSLQYSFVPEARENASSLTLPYVDFLQLLTKFDEKQNLRGTSKWAVDYIEKNMTKGRIAVKKSSLPMIQYQPEGADTMIPLYVASSIVTEVSPLLLLFKSNIDFKSLIIEEPEAHLHPSLQQQMSRFIINLVNRGIPVWITTHSDTILQHINSMIMLQNNQDVQSLSEHYGYKKQDLLNAKDVSMYEFGVTDKGKTCLRTLDRTNYGFVVPTFNNAIEKIVNEVYMFQGE